MKKNLYKIAHPVGVVALLGLMFLAGCGTSTNFYDVQAAQYESLGRMGAAREIRLAEEARQKTERMKLLTSASTGGTTVTQPGGATVTVDNANPYLYLAALDGLQVGNGAGGGPGNTARPVQLPQPVKVQSGWEKGLAVTLAVLDGLATPLSNVALADIQRRGHTDVARINMEATLGQAEYSYLERSAMYETFGGMTRDAIGGMTEVATTATTDMRLLGQSYGSEMKQVATTYATEATKQAEAYTENFRNNTYVQLESYHSEISTDHSSSSSNSSTHTTTFPDFTDWPTIIVGDDEEADPTP